MAIAGTPEANRVGRLLSRLTKQVRQTLQTADATTVHDLRVTIRRLRQALILFFPEKASKKLAVSLKTLLPLAGAVRDCDITMDLLRKSKLPEAVAVQSRCHQQRDVAWLALSGSLKDWASQDHPIPSPQSPPNRAEGVLLEVAKDFFHRGNAAKNGASAKELHKFRIAAKKYRYSLDCFGPDLSRLRKKVEAIQTLLGRINDCAAARRITAGLGGGKQIDAELKKKQKKRIKDFHKHWSGKLARKLKHTSHFPSAG